jgi:hypothetical protein
MLLWLAVLFVVDYVLRYDFRQTQWTVINFVVLYFARMGGMIGIASHAGWGWTISVVILFSIPGCWRFCRKA